MLDDADTVATMKSKMISCAGHEWRRQEQIIRRVTKRIPESKTSLGCSRQRWMDKVKKMTLSFSEYIMGLRW